MIIETFRQAIQNVWSNKLRTFLTMLGIIIGVMAVIVIVGLGNGMTKSMRDSFSALGTNTLSVQVWGNGSRTVSVEEMYKLPTEYPELIQSISPQIDFSGSGTLKIGTNSYRWSNISATLCWRTSLWMPRATSISLIRALPRTPVCPTPSTTSRTSSAPFLLHPLQRTSSSCLLTHSAFCPRSPS